MRSGLRAGALPDVARSAARIIAGAGGRPLVVGGWVRDALRGQPSKDIDIEVYGLDVDQLATALAQVGEVIEVGRAFGVLRVKGIDIDFSLPRTDSKVGDGHRGFDVTPDPNLDYATAFRRRDLTVNSLGFDPVSGEIIDPHGGLADLEAGVLRATDASAFAEDPLRGLRAAQFAARLEMQPDAELAALSRELPLDQVAPERLYEEWCKLLLKGRRPSVGLNFLRDSTLLRFFPALEALIDVPQDPRWHPEGDVWIHTLMVVDEAAALRQGAADDAQEDPALMFGALCHDLGKPATTHTDPDGAIRSPAHDVEGLPPTEAFMAQMRAPGALTKQVGALVRWHLAPALYAAQGAKDKAYRKLARALGEADVSPALLARLARADHLGRTTEDALARRCDAADAFVERMDGLGIKDTPPADIVLGRHLIAAGIRPGPEMGVLLKRCRDVQDETGLEDVDEILALARA